MSDEPRRENPSISIVIPTCNDGRFLEKCVEAVDEQTIPVSEIIIVDDGTTNSMDRDAVTKLVKCHALARLIEQPHSGPAAARNRGLEVASGEFLAFVDVDDRLRDDCIADRYAHFLKYPDLAAAFGGYQAVNESDADKCSTFVAMDKERPDSGRIGRPGGFPGGLPMYLFRTETLRDVGGLDESLLMMEDFDLILRVVASGGLISGSNEPTYFRTIRSDSHSRKIARIRLSRILKFLRKAQQERYFSPLELGRRFLSAVAEYLRAFL